MITRREASALIKSVSFVIRKYVAIEIKDLEERLEKAERKVNAIPPLDIQAVAERAAALVPAGKDGQPGEKGERGEQGEVGPRGLEGFPGMKGEPGERGMDGIQGPAGPIGLAGGTGPQGERGLPGESIQGPQGERGESGQSIVGERGEVGPVGPQGPVGKDGESIRGEKGDSGERGINGPPGKDAVLPDLEPLIQRAFDSGFSKWAVDMERRAHDLFQRAIDKMPKPIDGKDGFELEDLSVTDDGHGNVTLTFKRGELARSFTLRLPCFEYCGVFVEGQRYLAGHGVTFGGSFRIARKDDAQGKPGDRDTDWILAVKKGRDGRDGVMKNPPPEGPVKLK